MVDVGDKDVTERHAHASAKVYLPAEVQRAVKGDEIESAKGPVFQTAIIAGTMGAKRTHDLIPFCHPLGLESCKISITMDEAGVALIDCRVRVTHKTGVEMEAMVAASVASLTIYDMLKAVDRSISIEHLVLLEKSGGRSGH